MANMQRLEELVGVLEAHPEGHDQKVFGKRTACGSVRCAAGWTVDMWGSGIDWGRAYIDHGSSVTLSGAPIGREATRLLQLTKSQADALFYNARDLDDIKNVVKAIANGELV